MKPTRRGFLKTIAVGILGNSLISSIPLNVLAQSKGDDGSFEIQHGFRVFNTEAQLNMEALAETIIPGSKKIGMRKIFLDYVSSRPGLAGFLDAGIWNMDAVCRHLFTIPYYDLTSDTQKQMVLDHISERNMPFVVTFRRTVIELYYTSPEVWKKLSYNGPPQPKGFMDYSLPPKS